MDYKNIIFENIEGIAYLRLNRPNAMNALNSEVLDELDSAIGDIAINDDIKCVIITGSGRAFVAGADISQMSLLNVMEGRDMTIKGQHVMSKIEKLDKPVIAAVNGYALGGGCELAMACDFRIASTEAKFGQPEVNLGIIPGYGGTQRLPRLVGEGMAKYLIFSADIIDAEEAFRIGLVQKVVPAESLLSEAKKTAEIIMSKAQIAIKMAKKSVNVGRHMDLSSAVAFEAEAYVSTFCSADRVEGMSAFLEKRKANFENK